MRSKRRKQRVVPLTSQTVKALKRWLKERGGEPDEPLFPSNRGGPLSRDAVEWLISKHTATAATKCPSLNTKRVTAHVLRHTNAMTLLQSDMSTIVIALWLGHEQESTTRDYLHGDLRLKQRALDRTAQPGTRNPARPIPRHRPAPQIPHRPLNAAAALCRIAHHPNPRTSRTFPTIDPGDSA